MGKQVFQVVGEPIADRTVDEVAEEIENLAHHMRRTSDRAKRQNLADTIMHLAADIAATE